MDNITLPEILPVFPLTGVLLLPGMLLPLHIFEPRYRALVADALAGTATIGLIQPLVPRQDNRPPPGADQDTPQLYPVGCAGMLEAHTESPDGRYLIHLRGISRFRILEELPLQSGYRRVRAEYIDPVRPDAETAGDREEAFDGAFDGTFDGAALRAAFREFAADRGLQVDWAEMDAMEDTALLNSLAMSLPYEPAEKQALLEAADLPRRAEVLISLLSLGSTVDPLADPTPPKVN